MATCSYQTLARFDDCSPSHRARDFLDYVRHRERDHIHRSRSNLKIVQMLENRASLIKMLDSDMDNYQYDFSDEQSCDTLHHYIAETPSADWCYDEVDSTLQSQMTPPRSAAPSPTWSTSTSDQDNCYRTSPIKINVNNLPSYFLETPSPTSSMRSSKDRYSKTPRNHNLFRSTNTPTSSVQSQPDPEITIERLIQLQALITTAYTNADLLSAQVVEHWQILDQALSCDSVAHDAIKFIHHLLSQGLLNSAAVLHMIQYGLVYKMKHLALRGNAFVLIVANVITDLCVNTPSVIPYMIDMCSASGLFTTIISRMYDAQTSEIVAITESFHKLVELIFPELYTNQPHWKPILPPVLSRRGYTPELQRSYGPAMTLTKIISVPLLCFLTDHLDRKNCRNSRLINMILTIIANSIHLAHVSPDNDWTVAILATLANYSVETKLQEVIKAIERLSRVVDSSDHCSQGNINQALTSTMDRCHQFASFYQQYYKDLASRFQEELANFNPDIITRVADDLWLH